MLTAEPPRRTALCGTKLCCRIPYQNRAVLKCRTSFVAKPRDTSMPHHFVHDLRAVFESRAARPAIVHQGRTFTYGELDRQARHFASRLQAAGVAPGDRVALFSEKKLPFLVAHLGVFFAGGVPLPLNPRFTREEMRYFLADSEARAVLAGDGQRGLVESLAAELARPPHVIPDVSVFEAGTTAFREPD